MASAWQHFYRLYNRIIERFAMSCRVPASDLNDCTQEVWAAVIADLQCFNYDASRGKFRSWLFTRVRNKATDLIRKKTRHRATNIDGCTEAQESKGPELDPASAFEQCWNLELVHAVLDELRPTMSDRSYRVLYMRWIEQRSVTEVAAALSLTPEQVRARQHRAQQRFRDQYVMYTGQEFEQE